MSNHNKGNGLTQVEQHMAEAMSSIDRRQGRTSVSHEASRLYNHFLVLVSFMVTLRQVCALIEWGATYLKKR